MEPTLRPGLRAQPLPPDLLAAVPHGRDLTVVTESPTGASSAGVFMGRTGTEET
jgi:hypothetical protein